MSTAYSSIKLPDEGALRKLQYYGLLLVGIITTIYHLWFARTYGIAMDLHLVVHLWTMMVIAALFVFDPSTTRADGILQVVDNYLVIPLEIVLASFTSYYMFTNFQRLYIESLGVYNDVDILVGAILIFLVIDLSRRTFGWVIAAVGILGLFYASTGGYWPGVLGTQSIPFRSLIAGTTVQFTGLYDLIVRVSATYIIIFLLFAGFLESYGALEYFIRIGSKVGSKFRSGVTQTAVIASIGMGSVNGSAAANAATTGAMTIPLMKSQGIKDDTAGAIEAVASSGGQIMPPVMGAAAFLMVEIIGTSYLRIITIALLPALLFYLSIVVAVYLITDKENADLAGLANIEEHQEELGDIEPSARERIEEVSIGSSSSLNIADIVTTTKDKPFYVSLFEGFYLWGPILVLVYTLVVLRYGALTAGFWSCMTAIICALIQYVALGDGIVEPFKLWVANTADGMRLGSQNSAAIAMAAAVMALFIEALNITGFTILLTQQMVSISGGSLAVLLIVAMIASILFGLGMPTTGAYLVSVLLIAPALVQLGMAIETAHFYVFYFAILSALTPPVAIANVITSNITGASFVRTCYKSLIIGAPLFILPYVFVANPVLLFWEIPLSFYTFVVLFLAMIGISAAVINYFFDPIPIVFRAILLVMGVMVIFSSALPLSFNSWIVQGAGAMIILGVFVLLRAMSNGHLPNLLGSKSEG